MDTTMMPTVLATSPVYAVLPAEDLERARAYYRDVLGLRIEDYPDAGEFTAEAGGGTRVMLYERARTTAQHTALGFVVDDIAQAMSELRDRGVTFEEYDQPGLKTEGGIAHMGDSMVAWFIDTEGNILSLSEMPG